MRFKQFRPRTLTEADLQQLDELRMNPTTLQQFGSSDAAKGIMAGFEAELVFTGQGGESDYDEDPEPDYDADERCRSVQQVIDFFENDEYGYGIGGRDAEQLQEGLDEKYMEWVDEEMYRAFKGEAEDLIKKVIEDEDFDWDDETRKQLELMDLSEDEVSDALIQGSEAPQFNSSVEQREAMKTNKAYANYINAREEAEGLLDELVNDSVRAQDKYWDQAIEDFRNDFYVDDDSGFFDDVGLRYMSDVANEFSLMWPVMSYTGQSSEGGWSDDNARQLADDLADTLDVKTKVSGGYHSATRDAVTWIFEPDSSLDSDDSDNMAVEIISPPMPLEECLAKMQQFFEWAESNGAYSNSSTGFHMGVSLPHRGGNVDYVKLALFLGDEHILKEFGRSSNHFCEAAIKKIRSRVKGNKEAVAGALDLMKNNLIELAQKALEINNHGFGKYTSINPQGGNDNTNPAKERGAKYIEFRSAGGSNYFEDIDKLKNTLLRYAQAMTIAADPSAERREYYKKLYKLISPPEGDAALDLFSRFATGSISSEELKKSWADKQLEKEPKGDWVLWDFNGKKVPGQEYNGYTKTEAWERAKQKVSPGGSMEGFQKAYTLRPMRSATGDWEVYDVNTGETLETLHGYETRGAAADAVYDKYAVNGTGFNLRPADPEAPEKPLTKRERLAKNIKQAPAEEVKNWKVYDKKTGEVHYEQEGRKSSLVQIMRKFEHDHKLPQGQLAIEEIPTEKEPVVDQDNLPHTWEFYYAPTGRVLDQVSDISASQARAVLGDTIRRYDDLDSNQIRMRTVPTDASQQRYNDRQELNPVTDQPPEGFTTQRPATGDYYEVRSGDRVYGYVSTEAATSNVRSMAIEVKTYINQLTGRDDAQLVYRAGDPVQSRAPNGVPLWQIYQRDNGHVIHSFPDHDQTSAWATAQGWLRDHGAEDPSVFSLRPMMSA